MRLNGVEPSRVFPPTRPSTSVFQVVSVPCGALRFFQVPGGDLSY